MVVHQDKCVDGYTMRFGGLAQETPVMVAVGFIGKNGASVHAALGDMHGVAGQIKAGLSGHAFAAGMGFRKGVPVTSSN